MATFTASHLELGDAIRRASREDLERGVAAIRRTVHLRAPRICQALVDGENPKPVDIGTYRRSFQVDDVQGGAVLYNFAPHGPVIEDGRRPGSRMPPVDLIYRWVKRKRIGSSIHGPVQEFSGPRRRGAGNRSSRVQAVAAQQMHIALMIARKIAARGLPAHHILARAETQLTPMVEAAFLEALGSP